MQNLYLFSKLKPFLDLIYMCFYQTSITSWIYFTKKRRKKNFSNKTDKKFYEPLEIKLEEWRFFSIFQTNKEKKPSIIAMSSSISFYSTDFLLFQLKTYYWSQMCCNGLHCFFIHILWFLISFNSLWDFSSCGMLFCIVWNVIWDEWWTWMIVWNVMIPLMLLCAVRLLSALLEGSDMNRVNFLLHTYSTQTKNVFIRH